MSNTSATGGYLSPLGTAPAEDRTFELQLQALIVGITGLSGDLVRRRWQADPPKQPEANIDWCAIGVIDVDQDANATIIHHPDGDGSDELQRHELITALASFYGPNCFGNAALLRDGLWISQNRETMRSQGMGLYDVGQAVTMSALTNQTNIRRADLTFRVKRIVSRTYPVLNVLSASGLIQADTPAGNPASQPFSVEP